MRVGCERRHEDSRRAAEPTPRVASETPAADRQRGGRLGAGTHLAHRLVRESLDAGGQQYVRAARAVAALAVGRLAERIDGAIGAKRERMAAARRHLQHTHARGRPERAGAVPWARQPIVLRAGGEHE